MTSIDSPMNLAGNENVLTDNMFLFLHHSMSKLYQMGYLWICHEVPGRSAQDLGSITEHSIHSYFPRIST